MDQQNHLLQVFDQLTRPRVLVLGDLILDRYTWGDAERVSQEAPVLVLRSGRREARLGGAASVCQLLRGLEAEATCVGVVGADMDGVLVRELLGKAGVDHKHVLTDPARPTTVKERFIGLAQNRHPHQILRVDNESRSPVDERVHQEIVDCVRDELPKHDVLLISDYDKGVCTPELLREVIAAAKAHGVHVLADPIRGSDYSRYHGVTLITPNRSEAQAATGLPIQRAKDACRLGQQLCRELDLQAAVITLDRDGMALVPPDGGGVVYSTRPRTVYDITGAGDMVLATIGLCVAAKVSLPDAVQLANAAGGLEVEKVGVVPITRAELRADLERSVRTPNKIIGWEQAAEIAQSQQAQDRRVVFTNGCFDILHVGHVTYLQEAASMGDSLVVGLNSDESVHRLKGPSRPVVSQNERAATIAGLACVDWVVIFDQDTPLELIKQIQPDVLVKGGGYSPEEIVGHDFVRAYGGEIRVTGMVGGVSTSEILHRAAEKQSVAKPHFTLAKSKTEQRATLEET
ncbi:MAG: D-glycero-beta-D-manno-heptose 1-phosphate adenylyltransferase [Planctomycetales bacterium]